MDSVSSNRRHSSRVRLSSSCAFGTTEDTPRSGVVTSLSLRGCFIKTRAWAENGLKMYVKIWLPDGGWLPLRATVIYHIDKVGVGLTFDELDGGAEESISRVMTEAESSPTGEGN